MTAPLQRSEILTFLAYDCKINEVHGIGGTMERLRVFISIRSDEVKNRVRTVLAERGFKGEVRFVVDDPAILMQNPQK